MNAKTRTVTTLAAALFAFCLFSPARTASAQSNCRKVKASAVDVTDANDSNLATGRITRGGILNGTTETVFSPVVIFTPDPTTVSFIGDSTFTTRLGLLKTHNVYIFDIVRGVGTGLYRVDPSASTGIFAGATGLLYINGKSTAPRTVESSLTGEICLAGDAGADDDEDEGDDN